MNYKAPDGHIMVSSPNHPVTYTCPQTNLIEGIFHSVETKATGSNPAGIEQINITRIVDSTTITITITESTLDELFTYQQEINSSNFPIEPNFDINNN